MGNGSRLSLSLSAANDVFLDELFLLFMLTAEATTCNKTPGKIMIEVGVPGRGFGLVCSLRCRAATG